jgi:hypothetical protein
VKHEKICIHTKILNWYTLILIKALDTQVNMGHNGGNVFFCNKWVKKWVQVDAFEGHVLKCSALSPGKYLISQNKAYTAEFQQDGTIAVYVIIEILIQYFTHYMHA